MNGLNCPSDYTIPERLTDSSGHHNFRYAGALLSNKGVEN